MSDNTKKILEMLSENKITADEAYRLLEALKTQDNPSELRGKDEKETKKGAKYMRVTVTPGEDELSENKDRVNVRIPLSLLKTGMKFTSVIPPQAFDYIDGALKDKGIELDLRNLKNLKKEDVDDLIEALSDMEIDVESGNGEKVKVFVE